MNTMNHASDAEVLTTKKDEAENEKESNNDDGGDNGNNDSIIRNNHVDDDDNIINLWTREETPILNIPIIGDFDDDQKTIMMKIKQYGSDDNRWGIHSCIWDGGIGLLSYFIQQQKQVGVGELVQKEETLIVDLGSGTGIVGIGMAYLGYRNVVLTDLNDAMSLMNENIQLNIKSLQQQVIKRQSSTTTSKQQQQQQQPPLQLLLTTEELTWEEDSSVELVLSERFQKLLNSYEKILFVGSDIIYRQNLFHPLLSTIKQLLLLQQRMPPPPPTTTTTATKNNESLLSLESTTTTTTTPLQKSSISSSRKCIMSIQSIRQHLNEFIKIASSKPYNFKVIHKQNIFVPDGSINPNECSKVRLQPHSVIISSENKNEDDTNNAVVDCDNNNKGKGIINIFEFELLL